MLDPRFQTSTITQYTIMVQYTIHNNVMKEYLRYMGRRSVITDQLFSVRLQGGGLAYAAGAPARGALLAEGRCCAEILQQYNI